MTDLRTPGIVGPHRESHEPRLLASAFVESTPGFLEWDGTSGLTNWGMDGNDRYGCCGFAALDHANEAKLGDATQAGTTFFPQFKTLLDAYFAYGIAQGEPGPQPDQGVSNAAMLAWAYKEGIINGYAEVPLDQLDFFAQKFHGVIVGLSINDQQASEDFVSHQPWDAMTNVNAGHDVLGIITHADGTGEVVTWGTLQPYTAAFRSTNFQDAWVVFDKDDPYVNWTALEAALTELHGVVNPIQPAASLSPWKKAVDGLDKLRDWTRDRELAHKLAVEAIENESVSLLAGEIGRLLAGLTV